MILKIGVDSQNMFGGAKLNLYPTRQDFVLLYVETILWGRLTYGVRGNNRKWPFVGGTHVAYGQRSLGQILDIFGIISDHLRSHLSENNTAHNES